MDAQHFRRQGGFPPKTKSIPKIFSAQPHKAVFCVSVGFYDIAEISPPQSVELHKV